jgi:hypothetical protein
MKLQTKKLAETLAPITPTKDQFRRKLNVIVHQKQQTANRTMFLVLQGTWGNKNTI